MAQKKEKITLNVSQNPTNFSAQLQSLKQEERNPYELSNSQQISPLIGSKYEETSIDSGFETLKEYTQREDRQEYFGNTLTFSESLQGVLRRAKDSSLTPTLFYDWEENNFLNPAIKGDPAHPMSREDYEQDPAIPQEFRDNAKFDPDLNLNREMILKRVQRWKERKQAEEIERYASTWQKAGRFVATMGASLGTDLIPNVATGLYGLTAKTLTKAFLYAGTENLMFDELVEFFNSDRLIDEGEKGKTFAERNEERLGAFLLGGTLGTTFKAVGNVLERARTKNQAPDAVLNELQTNLEDLQKEAEVFKTEILSDMQKSDKITDLNNAKAMFEATLSNDVERVKNLMDSESLIKSYQGLVGAEKQDLPTDFKIPDIEQIVNTDYVVMDIRDISKLAERSGGYSVFRGKKSIDDPSEKVLKMAKNIDPDRLLLGKNFDDGAPLIDGSNGVVIGDNRLQALEIAYRNGLGVEYLNRLKKYFPQHSIEGKKYPVLVKRINNKFTETETLKIREKKGTFVRGERSLQILQKNSDIIRNLSNTPESLKALKDMPLQERLDALSYIAFNNENIVNGTSDLAIVLRQIATETVDIKKKKPEYDISKNLSDAFEIIELTKKNPAFLKRIIDENEINPVTTKFIKTFFADPETLQEPLSNKEIKKLIQNYYKATNNAEGKTKEELLNIKLDNTLDVLPTISDVNEVNPANLAKIYQEEFKEILDKEKTWQEIVLDFVKCKNNS